MRGLDMNSQVHIVIPVLNEYQIIRNNLGCLNRLSTRVPVIFVDGNSCDNSADLLADNDFNVVTTSVTGRGAQLCAGVRQLPSECRAVIFLHVDTRLPDNFDYMIKSALNQSVWGHFTVKLDSDRLRLRIIQLMMNLRSKISGIATGDQAIFVDRSIVTDYLADLEQHPLMEDIYLSKTLKNNHGPASVINQPVITSPRYWIKNGILKSVLKMWKFRLLYYFGHSPRSLYQQYYK